MPSRILLTGGAGYIGSHTYVALVAAGYEVVILDNFSNAHHSVIDRLAQITDAPVQVLEGSVLDEAFLAHAFEKYAFDAVVHFAALKAVAESVERPLDYIETNCKGLLNLLRAMERKAVHRLVFSSSATVYGVPDESPTPETAPRQAVNPYGFSKIAGEEILEQISQNEPRWAFGILRYFNPAGAHDSALIGEDPTDIPNNLMPYVAKVALGEMPKVNVFGSDYPTPDGTGVRDYIHVEDLAQGHVLSLQALLSNKGGHLVNLGTGTGYSVIEVIEAYSRACGQDLPYEIVDRRPGDVPIYCAIPDKARSLLGFKATRGLDDMCRSSWNWVSRRRNA